MCKHLYICTCMWHALLPISESTTWKFCFNLVLIWFAENEIKLKDRNEKRKWAKEAHGEKQPADGNNCTNKMTKQLMKAAEVKESKSLSHEIYPFKEDQDSGKVLQTFQFNFQYKYIWYIFQYVRTYNTYVIYFFSALTIYMMHITFSVYRFAMSSITSTWHRLSGKEN